MDLVNVMSIYETYYSRAMPATTTGVYTPAKMTTAKTVVQGGVTKTVVETGTGSVVVATWSSDASNLKTREVGVFGLVAERIIGLGGTLLTSLYMLLL